MIAQLWSCAPAPSAAPRLPRFPLPVKPGALRGVLLRRFLRARCATVAEFTRRFREVQAALYSALWPMLPSSPWQKSA